MAMMGVTFVDAVLVIIGRTAQRGSPPSLYLISTLATAAGVIALYCGARFHASMEGGRRLSSVTVRFSSSWSQLRIACWSELY